MKESIGYSVTINIVITFKLIVFSFLASSVVYYKTNKAKNVIVDAVQKYEGYNKSAKTEILRKLSGIGYSSRAIKCESKMSGKSAFYSNTATNCTFVDPDGASVNNNRGFCVYKCIDTGKEDYYYYKVRINMMINIPVVGDILDIPIYSNTDRIFDFEKKFNGV